MLDPFIRKLKNGAYLTGTDEAKLASMAERRRRVPPHEDLVREGERPEDVHVILDGLACRYKLLKNGSRQICAYLTAGDFCNLNGAVLGQMDHSVATLSPCVIADIPRAMLDEASRNHPNIARALWWSSLIDEATLRQWLIGMGRRPADRQMAHLFCELHARLDAIGLVRDGAFELPLTQEELADTLGLSIVHVNRVLQGLREEGLIGFRRKVLSVLDLDRLRGFADFNPSYLHLQRPTDQDPALRSASGAEA